MKRWLWIVSLLCVANATAQELPPDLPAVTNVRSVPVLPPSAPLPPPVTPTFVKTPIPEVKAPAVTTKPAAAPATKPSALQNAAKDALNLINNPQQIQNVIAQAPQQLHVLAGKQDPTQFNGNNFAALKWKNSLMFPDDQLQKLYDAARGLTDQSVGAVMVEIKVPRVAPAFFLNSVLYNTPSNWTIWLNSRRIRAGSKFPELDIARVNEDAVEFLWKTDQLDFISPDWEKKVPAVEVKPGEPVPIFAYQSPDGLIAVDRTRRFVRFTLGPHQTFVSHDMRIVEGYAKSSIFETVKRVATTPPGGNTPQIQIQAPPAPAAAAATPAPAKPIGKK